MKVKTIIADGKPFTAAPCCSGCKCHTCRASISNTSKAWIVQDDKGDHRICSKCFDDFAQSMNDIGASL